MNRKVLFYLKNYLGFSQRESKGFLLVIPVLFILYFVPDVIDGLQASESRKLYQEYLKNARVILSELDTAQAFEPINDPLPNLRLAAALDTGGWQNKQSSIKKLDFSEADSVLLQIVPGVGAALASRIVKFREGLGGMHSKTQLEDVYGLKPETARKVFEYFEFSPMPIKKISLNLVEVQQLAQHPYIGYGEAKVLVAYRKQHGPYHEAGDLVKIKIFNQTWIDKVVPYLDFEMETLP
ncbi:hypothetical protein GCM10007049_37740 [Echinicola pacifica]|uniref:DNA uptake protein ComE n=1 Tax=Echinicola pacifica TaxID=346377 RepID=A0A918QBY4_9BACT|nr:helix-hairpin-helix domain-containing protein [Echinicola pacifica]GGZ40867.1 hypothetical protein GCM10007049_37740 [Echinicola pacifica]